MAERTCRECGTAIPAEAHKGRIFCSLECRKVGERIRNKDRAREAYRAKAAIARQAKQCRICQGPLPFRKSVICSPKCQREVWRLAYRRLNGSDGPKACTYCGTMFEQKGTARLCSDECRTASLADFHRAKRARKRNAKTETVRTLDVLNRDGWKCGLCGRKINARHKYPHPRSASLDHIVPLSRGGEHSMRNVQASCLECNLKKRTAPMGEQLRLIG